MGFYVYIYFDPRRPWPELPGEPIYVGKGCGYRYTLRRAKGSHIYNRLEAMRRAGVEPIRLQVLTNLSEQDAFDWEVWLIRYFGRRNLNTGPLCNLTDGGEGTSGRVTTAEHRANYKAANQKSAQDPEWRAKTKAANQKNSQDPEWRARHKAANQKRRVLTVEQVAVIRASNKACSYFAAKYGVSKTTVSEARLGQRASADILDPPPRRKHQRNLTADRSEVY